MKIVRFLLAIGFLTLGASCVTGHGRSAGKAATKLRFAGKTWRLAHESSGAAGTIREYVLPKEALGKWSELLTIQSIPQDYLDFKTETLIKELKADILNDCPGALWQTIVQVPGEVIYEWQSRGCDKLPDQHEIARVRFTTAAIQRIAYVRKGPPLSIQERNHWVLFLGSAPLHFPNAGE